MSRFPVEQLPIRLQSIDMANTEVNFLPDWQNMSEPARLAFLRTLIQMSGRDPRLTALAVGIFRKAGVPPRAYKDQAAALLKWVQSPENTYYVNEPSERLQLPMWTVKHKISDCDDQVILLCALFESVRLPWKLVLAGTQEVGWSKTKKKIRYIEGTRFPAGKVKIVHIYALVGTPPFKPNRWYFCETTIQGVPLGWDIIDGDKAYLPEMDVTPPGPPLLMLAPKAPRGFRPAPLPPLANRSPAYSYAINGFEPSTPALNDAAYGQMSALSPVAAYVGSSIASDVSDGLSDGSAKKKLLDFEEMLPGIVTGVAVAVSVQLILDYIRPKLHLGKEL